MKQVLFFTVLFLLCFNLAEVQAQTYANVPGPENVLVVYNSGSSVSDSIKNYYVTARNIPAVNVVGLDSLIEKTITIDGVTHQVVIAQETDIIQDFYQDSESIS